MEVTMWQKHLGSFKTSNPHHLFPILYNLQFLINLIFFPLISSNLPSSSETMDTSKLQKHHLLLRTSPSSNLSMSNTSTQPPPFLFPSTQAEPQLKPTVGATSSRPKPMRLAGIEWPPQPIFSLWVVAGKRTPRAY